MEEPFLPLPTARGLVPITTQFRSTWLTSSIRALRDRDLFAGYLTKLPARYHPIVQNTGVGEWLDAEVAVAHYEACDRLELDENTMFQIGLETTRVVHHASIALILRLARQAGGTPWTILGQVQRFWERTWVGGAVGVSRLGPKEAIVEIVGFSSSKVRYCRLALRGVVQGMMEPFCRRAFVKVLPQLCSKTSLGYQLSWA